MTNRIAIDPEVRGGRPWIRSLRIRVKDILDMLAGRAAARKFWLTSITHWLPILLPRENLRASQPTSISRKSGQTREPPGTQGTSNIRYAM